MFVMGDEVRRTQHGNNNAYCQDNETSWFDWSLLTKHADVHRFVKLLIARRLLRDSTAERQRITLTELISSGINGWHGVRLNHPDWGYKSHSVAFSAESRRESLCVYFIFNAYWESLEFELPRIGKGKGASWRRWIDTFLDPPFDIVAWQEAPAVQGQLYRAGPQSVVVLVGLSFAKIPSACDFNGIQSCCSQAECDSTLA
jgi:glycogen operon protein